MFRCMVFSTFASMYKWDRLGPSALCWDTLLQCSHMDKRLLQQKNIEKKKKKLQRIKNNCMHRQLGQIMNSKTEKDQKTNYCFWGSGSNNSFCAWSLHMAPPGAGWTTSATLLAQPLDCPHPRLIWGTHSPPLKEQAREVVTCFCCLLLQPKSQ